VTVTARPAGSTTSAELFGLLEQAEQLAGSANRPDLTDRLAPARAALAGRGVRVLVLGAPGQGATSLTHVLDQTPKDWLPGATFMDAPGRPGSGPIRLPEPGVADVVLFVSDAGHEYGPAELDALARLRAQGTTVAGVITKIDAYPRWGEVQRANRQRLQSAGLDSPSIPLLPVSAAMRDSGRQRNDDSLSVASGVPQLVEFLRDRIGTRVDPRLRDQVLADLGAVADELGRGWNRELEGMQGTGGTPAQRQARAVTELERRQQLSVNWQIALGDGVTELVAQTDFDLRERLREVMEVCDAEIVKANPAKHWTQFDNWVRGKVSESVQTSFQLARNKARGLAEQVGSELAGNQDGSAQGVQLPDVRVANPDQAMRQVKPMQPLEGNGGVLARVVNSLRGGYSGILMVGVLVSLAGLSLINPWSVGAGVALGAFTFYEDFKNGKERSKAEARMAVSKLMDDANFRVGDELRTQLRAVHRTLRDHYTVINDQRLRAASDAVRAAADSAGSGANDARLGELQNSLAEVRQLRGRITEAAR
jgi:hypothetical protein